MSCSLPLTIPSDPGILFPHAIAGTINTLPTVSGSSVGVHILATSWMSVLSAYDTICPEGDCLTRILHDASLLFVASANLCNTKIALASLQVQHLAGSFSAKWPSPHTFLPMHAAPSPENCTIGMYFVSRQRRAARRTPHVNTRGISTRQQLIVPDKCAVTRALRGSGAPLFVTKIPSQKTTLGALSLFLDSFIFVILDRTSSECGIVSTNVQETSLADKTSTARGMSSFSTVKDFGSDDIKMSTYSPCGRFFAYASALSG